MRYVVDSVATVEPDPDVLDDSREVLIKLVKPPVDWRIILAVAGTSLIIGGIIIYYAT